MASNIEVKLDVLNQLASPALYAAALANRPAASFTGRLFVDSDSPSTGIYRDTGSSWIQIADSGAGTTGTLQQVTTNGSSTTVGISTSGNGIGIGTTIPASNRLDIHSGTGLQATFNGTGVTNAAIQLQLAGVGKWTLQNNYNAAANDFVITDVLNTLPRLTIKNTGQSFFGTVVTSSGLLVVNSSTSDNHFVAIGANAPSLRLRDAGTGGILSCGIGISTAANNFIQSSVSGDFCFFNSNTTASPIIFGIYNGTNTQEAVRITAARNLLVGNPATDTGQKLIVNGTSLFTSNLTTNAIFIGRSDNGQAFACGNGTNADMGIFVQASNIRFSNSYSTGIDFSIGGTTRFAMSTTNAIFSVPIQIGNSVSASVLNTVTTKVSILINGVQYYLLASTSST